MAIQFSQHTVTYDLLDATEIFALQIVERSMEVVEVTYDIVIKDSWVVDGTGKPKFEADIGIIGGKIDKIGEIPESEGDIVIDAKGLVTCPGFIDIHSHSDLSILANPKAESKIMQGITTEVIGNCGFSAAPVKEPAEEELKRELEKYGLDLTWKTMEEYFRRVEENGVSVNVVPLVGFGTIRACVMDYENRRPTKDELDEMKALTEQAMLDGAFGLSTGLIYAPCCYADTDEIVEVCKVVSRYGGIYASHIRGEGRTLVEAVREAIEIGERANVSVEISHHKAAGVVNWGKVRETIKMIEKARREGLNINFDVYPYTASHTSLEALMPPWVLEGGREKLEERLRDPKIREKIKCEIENSINIADNPIVDSGWDRIVPVYLDSDKELEGKSLEEIAKDMGRDPYDVFFELILRNKNAQVILHEMSEEDVITVMKHPLSMICTDSEALSTSDISRIGLTHPRGFGAFPRVLGVYVREKGVLTLEEAIKKMTSMAAKKLGIPGRGVIKEGAYADIVVFDLQRVRDTATYENPYSYPVGIEYVIVNGKITVEKGKHKGTLNGKVTRKIAQ